MNMIRTSMAIITLTTLALVSACDSAEEQKLDDWADKVGDSIDAKADSLGDSLEKSADRAEDSVEHHGDNLEEAADDIEDKFD